LPSFAKEWLQKNRHHFSFHHQLIKFWDLSSLFRILLVLHIEVKILSHQQISCWLPKSKRKGEWRNWKKRTKEKRKKRKKKRNTLVSERIIDKPKSQIAALITPFILSNKTLDLFFFVFWKVRNYFSRKKKKGKRKEKRKRKRKRNDLRSLWEIPNVFIILIPDAIPPAIFIIISLGISFDWLLIYSNKSVS